jgi:hypothetical protein
MRTPAGKECRYYYEDYFRGHSKQECRLLEQNPNGGRWKPGLCRTCSVPDILRQNACPNIVLEGRVHRSMLGLRERVQVYAICTRKMTEVENPAVGCGECHLHQPGAKILE